MLFREIIIVHSETHETINMLYGQNVEFLNIKADGTYNYHPDLKG